MGHVLETSETKSKDLMNLKSTTTKSQYHSRVISFESNYKENQNFNIPKAKVGTNDMKQGKSRKKLRV